jgi:hypothetical protein
MKVFRLIVAFAFLIILIGCTRSRKEVGGTPGNPEVVSITPINGGRDLEVVWRNDNNAEGYYVACDEQRLYSPERSNYKDTFQVISGIREVCESDIWGPDCREEERTCKYVSITSYRGDKQNTTNIDLTSRVFIVNGIIVSRDSNPAWIKLDLSNKTASLVSGVDTTLPNVVWFSFSINDGGWIIIGKGPSDLALLIHDGYNYTYKYLAPGEGYNDVAVISPRGGTRFFFWINNKENGTVDPSDYFGAVEFTGVQDLGGNTYKADIVIYLQDRVRGLRWLRY